VSVALRRTFSLAWAKVGKQYNGALRCRLNNMFCGAASLLILVAHVVRKPCNEPKQMFGHALIDDMLPMLAQLFGDGRLLGAAQPHDVIASP
jgi:hypothetical protein